MSDKKIVVTADVSQAKRELSKLTQELTKKQRLGVQFDEQTSSVFSGQATKNVQSLSRAMNDLPGMRGGAGGGGGLPPPMRGGGAGGGGFGNALTSLVSSMGGAKFLTAAGAAAAIGSRLFSSYNSAVSANQQYLTLRSISKQGRGEMQDKLYQGMNNLFSPEETRGMTIDFMRNVGYSPNDRTLDMMQKFSRGYGVDSSILSSTASSIYKAGGSGASVYKEQAEILASAIGSRIDRGKISEYLQTVATSIESMASQTAGVSTQNIATMLGLMNGMGGAMTPGLAATNLSKLDQSLRNPDQKQAAMTYSTIAQTLKQGGFEGDLPAAIRVIQETGLAGLNPEDLESKFPNLAKSGKLDEYKKIFKAWSPVNYTKNLAGNIEAATGNNTTLAGLYGGRFFAGGPTASSEFIEATKSGKFSNKEAEEWIKKMGPQTEANLSDVVKSSEGIQKKLEDLNKFNSETVGGKILPLVQDIQRALLTIESTLIPILKPMVTAMKWTNPISMFSNAINDMDNYDQSQGGNTIWGKAKKWLYGTGNGANSGSTDGAQTPPLQEPQPVPTPGMENAPGANRDSGWGDLSASVGSNLKFKNASAQKGYEGLAKKMQKDLADLSLPITITSGKRSIAENAGLAGHAKNSRHLTGEAADISVKNMTQAQINQTIKELQSKGYKAFVHSGPGIAPHIHTEMTGQRNSGTNKAIMPSDIVAYHH